MTNTHSFYIGTIRKILVDAFLELPNQKLTNNFELQRLHYYGLKISNHRNLI